MSKSVIIVAPGQLPAAPPAELLAQARQALLEPREPAQRYGAAYLAALRGAAAALAVRAKPGPWQRRPTAGVWVLLAHSVPELAEWAAYFAAGKIPPLKVSAERAEEMAREAGRFIGVVEQIVDAAASSAPATGTEG